MKTGLSHSRRALLGGALALGPVLAAISAPPAIAATQVNAVLSKTIKVNGLDIFYREAGPTDAPVLLLLHGFPSSSHMFRDLIPLLASNYRVLAPDYPGFGYSAAPALSEFPYTFEALANVVDGFATAVGATNYVIYMQDYGGPVGFRLALKHPERVRGLIVQNAVANVTGWNPDTVKQIAPFWQNRNIETEKPLRAMLKVETTQFQYLQGATRKERVSPDTWTFDQSRLDRPGNDKIQLELLFNYQDNVAQYPKWQAYLKSAQPPVLVVWGRNDPFFVADGADFFRREVPKAEVQLLNAGHFALETHAEEIAEAALRFLKALPR